MTDAVTWTDQDVTVEGRWTYHWADRKRPTATVLGDGGTEVTGTLTWTAPDRETTVMTERRT